MSPSSLSPISVESLGVAPIWKNGRQTRVSNDRVLSWHQLEMAQSRTTAIKRVFLYLHLRQNTSYLKESFIGSLPVTLDGWVSSSGIDLTGFRPSGARHRAVNPKPNKQIPDSVVHLKRPSFFPHLFSMSTSPHQFLNLYLTQPSGGATTQLSQAIKRKYSFQDTPEETVSFFTNYATRYRNLPELLYDIDIDDFYHDKNASLGIYDDGSIHPTSSENIIQPARPAQGAQINFNPNSQSSSNKRWIRTGDSLLSQSTATLPSNQIDHTVWNVIHWKGSLPDDETQYRVWEREWEVWQVQMREERTAFGGKKKKKKIEKENERETKMDKEENIKIARRPPELVPDPVEHQKESKRSCQDGIAQSNLPAPDNTIESDSTGPPVRPQPHSQPGSRQPSNPPNLLSSTGALPPSLPAQSQSHL